MGSPGPQDSEIARALAEGARWSREAQGPGGPAPATAKRPSPAPVTPTAPVPATRPPLVPAAFWLTPTGLFLVRHKWKFFGLLIFILTDLLLLTLGRVIARGPQ